MKVYIVMGRWWYVSFGVDSVYSTMELAKKAKDKLEQIYDFVCIVESEVETK